MARLVYKGKMAVGMQVAAGFQLPVEKGKEYEIPDWLAPQLLKSGEWFRPEAKIDKEKMPK